MLEGWARRRKTAQAMAVRSRVVLACADGGSNAEIAATLGVSRPTVTKWRGRFAADLLEEPAVYRAAIGRLFQQVGGDGGFALGQRPGARVGGQVAVLRHGQALGGQRDVVGAPVRFDAVVVVLGPPRGMGQLLAPPRHGGPPPGLLEGAGTLGHLGIPDEDYHRVQWIDQRGIEEYVRSVGSP